jgi:hypothetical protein
MAEFCRQGSMPPRPNGDVYVSTPVDRQNNAALSPEKDPEIIIDGMPATHSGFACGDRGPLLKTLRRCR